MGNCLHDSCSSLKLYFQINFIQPNQCCPDWVKHSATATDGAMYFSVPLTVDPSSAKLPVSSLSESCLASSCLALDFWRGVLPSNSRLRVRWGTRLSSGTHPYLFAMRREHLNRLQSGLYTSWSIAQREFCVHSPLSCTKFIVVFSDSSRCCD